MHVNGSRHSAFWFWGFFPPPALYLAQGRVLGISLIRPTRTRWKRFGKRGMISPGYSAPWAGSRGAGQGVEWMTPRHAPTGHLPPTADPHRTAG